MDTIYEIYEKLFRCCKFLDYVLSIIDEEIVNFRVKKLIGIFEMVYEFFYMLRPLPPLETYSKK